jgi:hypothetical protein
MNLQEIVNWLRTNAFAITLASLVVAIASIIIGGRRVDRKRLVLSYTVEPALKLDKVAKSFPGKAVLLYEGTEVEGVWIHTIGLRNVGNRALAHKDMIAPFRISVPESVKIFQSVVDRSWLSDAKSEQVDTDELEIALELLQPGESIEARFVAGSNRRFSPSIRAADFKIIPGQLVESITVLWQSALAAIIFFGTAVALFKLWPKSWWTTNFGGGLILFGFFAALPIGLSIWELWKMGVRKTHRSPSADR